MDEVWSVIKQIAMSGMKLFIPVVRLKSSQLPQWFNAELRYRYKRHKTSRHKYSKFPTEERMN